MTNEQAIDILDSLVGMLSINNVPADEALKMGISALEKQVPKKPTHDGIRHTCPTCHQPLPNVAHSNCMYCGQAIEWIESR